MLRIDPARRTVLCRAVDVGDADLQKAACALHTFTLEYDVLVLAPGAVPNTFGTPGVESHAMFFKAREGVANGGKRVGGNEGGGWQMTRI